VPVTSAGLLVYRREATALQVLLGHPGGPFWSRKDAGAWSMPKGEYDGNEEPLHAARREYAEELGVEPPDSPVRDLGTSRQKSGKVVRAYALEGDLDPAIIEPGLFEMEWPPKSGRRASFPEIDRVEWFFLEEARIRINPGQAVFLDRLEAELGEH
jgi:predicted NUDIX family NTP pyrophosphohydrolase